MNKLLIAVDGTKASKAVLNTLYSLVRQPDNVILLHVERLEGRSLMIDMLGEAELSTLRDMVKGTEHKERLDLQAEKILSYYRREIGEGTSASVSTVVRTGIPEEEILKVASEEKVDMILLGSNGRKGLSRLIAGSVAAAVQKRAEVPVLMAKRAAMCEEPYSWRDAYAAISVTTMVILGMFLLGVLLQKGQFIH